MNTQNIEDRYVRFPGDLSAKWQILSRLSSAEGKFVSGEELSSHLGISRPAIWKHIQALLKDGFPVQTVRRKGYRVPPNSDLILPGKILNALRTSHLGRTILYTMKTGSTNDDAKILADIQKKHYAGYSETSAKMVKEPWGRVHEWLTYPDGTLVIAEIQSKGKGRLGRKWESLPGGIFMSLILRPEIPPGKVPALSLVIGYAVAKTIREEFELNAKIKWPNDVLISNKKVAGILCEMRAELDRVLNVIVGIGINANLNVQSLPPTLQSRTTSLVQELLRPVDRNFTIASVLNNLEPCYQKFLCVGFSELLPSIQNLCAFLGKRVRVQNTALGELGTTEGIFRGIDSEGRLILQLVNGESRIFAAGDVSLRANNILHFIRDFPLKFSTRLDTLILLT